MKLRYLLPLVSILLILPLASASGPPQVSLESPQNGNLSSSGNMIFSCNATDDESIFRIDLYNDIAGSFGPYGIRRIMEHESDSNTLLLCHFNSNYTCDAGETGENSSTGIVSGMFMNGVMIDGTDTLRYPVAGNLNFSQGTIEFWIWLGIEPYSSQVYLFSTGESSQSDIQIYINYGNLYFDYWDDSSYYTSGYIEIPTWNENEWHHVAAVWDVLYGTGSGQVINLFVDGSNASLTFEYTDFGSVGITGDYLYIGSRTSGDLQADSVFDELRISDKERTVSEINESYQKGMGNHTQESANWSLEGIPDGSYSWNCLAIDNESQQSWAGQNYSFTIDTVTPPVVNNVTLSPDNLDDTDPGVTINVTANITDPSNVSFAILQYKYEVDWTNVTMEEQGGDLWNASFTTVGNERVYSYRIWSNDTLGNSNTSQTWTVNVTYDYTWSREPSYINTYGLVNSVGNVGMIRISNTGDDTLEITLTDDWPIVDVYYNTTSQFTVPSGNVTDINVTAKYAGQDSVNNMTINISAEPSAPMKTASPQYQTATVTMNSYTGGAYLHVEITEFSTTVYQGQTTNLTATVKNIGNETAEDVWLNWTLPSGWSVSSGNASTFIGNMSAQSTENTSEITASVTSSAAAGISSVCVNSSGLNVSGSDCENVAVLCSGADGACGIGCTYLNDDDCSAPPSGGGGGTTSVAGGVTVLGYGVVILMPERLDLVRGEDLDIRLEVSNPSNRTVLKNVTLSISGYPMTLASITPGTLDIGQGETKAFSVSLKAPDYLPYGKRTVTFGVSAEVSAGIGQEAVTVSNETLVGVVICSKWESVTSDLAENVRAMIVELKAAGADTAGLESLLAEAGEYIEESRHDEAKGILDNLMEQYQRANNSLAMITQARKSIEVARTFGVPVPQTEMFHELALSALRRGDFARAEERSRNAIMAYGIEAAGMVSLMGFVYENWALLIIMAVVSGASGVLGVKRARISIIGRKIRSLAVEERAAEKLIGHLQRQRFQTELKAREYLSGGEYRTAISEHESRISEIKRREVELASKRIRLISKKPLSCFEEQKRHIEDMIRNTQRQYFNLGLMGKDLYERTLKGLTLELAEVNKNIGAEKSRRTRFRFPLFSVLVALLILVSSVPAFAEEVTYAQASASIERAEKTIAEMQELGLGTSYANDTLAEARALLRMGYHGAAMSLADGIPGIRETAMNLSREIDSIEAELLESGRAGLNVTSAELLFERALEAFAREDYSETKSLLERASNTIDEVRSEAALEGLTMGVISGAWLFLSEYWHIVLALALSSALAGWMLLGRYLAAKDRKRIRALKKEIESVTGMMQDVQRRYFQEFSIDRKKYDTIMKESRERILRMRREIISLRDSAEGHKKTAPVSTGQ